MTDDRVWEKVTQVQMIGIVNQADRVYACYEGVKKKIFFLPSELPDTMGFQALGAHGVVFMHSYFKFQRIGVIS